MVEIRRLDCFTIEDEKSFGLNGFVTDFIYEVDRIEKGLDVTFQLKYRKLESTFTKE